MKLKAWDIRQEGSSPIFTNKRSDTYAMLIEYALLPLGCRFDAGVTTIQSHPHIEHIIAVGRSVYDRLHSLRKVLTFGL